MRLTLRPTQQRSRHCTKQRGQALVEYLIILPSLLLLTLGAIQFALLYQIKAQVNYATFYAARAGSLKNASEDVIKDAFGSAMAPLYTNKPNLQGVLRGRVIGAIEAFNPLTTKIERVGPGLDDIVEDFGEEMEGTKTKEVPVDNLTFRPLDPGAKSKINIQDANLLKLKTTYCAKLIVPVAGLTIYSLVNGIAGVKALAGEYFSQTGNTATSANMCSQLIHQAQSEINSVNETTSMFGFTIPADILDFILGPVQTILNTNIPLLNWSVGGYRIPVTSEAIVRMQSPQRK